jgi:hypothetical protein
LVCDGSVPFCQCPCFQHQDWQPCPLFPSLSHSTCTSTQHKEVMKYFIWGWIFQKWTHHSRFTQKSLSVTHFVSGKEFIYTVVVLHFFEEKRKTFWIPEHRVGLLICKL